MERLGVRPTSVGEPGRRDEGPPTAVLLQPMRGEARFEAQHGGDEENGIGGLVGGVRHPGAHSYFASAQMQLHLESEDRGWARHKSHGANALCHEPHLADSGWEETVTARFSLDGEGSYLVTAPARWTMQETEGPSVVFRSGLTLSESCRAQYAARSR